MPSVPAEGYSFDASTLIQGTLVLSPYARVTISADYDLTPASFADATRSAVAGSMASIESSQSVLQMEDGKHIVGTMSQTYYGLSPNGIRLPFTIGVNVFGNVYSNGAVPPVPEPETWMLSVVGIGLAGIGLRRKWRIAQHAVGRGTSLKVPSREGDPTPAL